MVDDDKLSKEHEALKHILQILTNAKVCDDSNLVSCKNWGVHIRYNIYSYASNFHFKLGIDPCMEYNNVQCWIMYLMSQEIINPTFLLPHMCVTCVKEGGWVFLGFFWVIPL